MEQSSSTGYGERGEVEEFLHPERTVSYFNLIPGMKAADFGSGHGFFAIPMARAVGHDGKVYAIDVQKATLNIIQSKAKLEHLLNVETIWSDIETLRGSKLPDNSIDFVLVSNILFQAEAKAAVFSEASRVLKTQGRLAVIEWGETPFPGGPPPNLLVSRDSVKNLAKEAGFEPDREFEAGGHHYGLLFRKS